jgi:5-methylcytosine-specific restriction endonuclease McrBC regulatory subunit McrC
MSAAEAMSEERRIRGIPIRNLYVMLAFADSLHGELGAETCGAIEQDEFPLDVLARLLAAKLVWIRRRGTPQRYRVRDDVGAMPEGAIDLPSTLRGMHLLQDRLAFQIDELQIDTPQNRLLCAGIRALLRATKPKINSDLRNELRRQLGGFSGVTYITSHDALRVEWTTHHGAYSSYREALALARLAVLDTLPDEGAHDQHWRKLLDNRKRMGELFEGFIRGFLKLHAGDRGSVTKPMFEWSGKTGMHVPRLRTDFMLAVDGSKHLTVGECKLYKSPLIDRYRSVGKCLRPSHVNQLFAYLSAARDRHRDHTISGLLIYALVDDPIREDVNLREFPVRIRTLDLQQPWKPLREQLEALWLECSQPEPT